MRKGTISQGAARSAMNKVASVDSWIENLWSSDLRHELTREQTWGPFQTMQVRHVSDNAARTLEELP